MDIHDDVWGLVKGYSEKVENNIGPLFDANVSRAGQKADFLTALERKIGFYQKNRLEGFLNAVSDEMNPSDAFVRFRNSMHGAKAQHFPYFWGVVHEFIQSKIAAPVVAVLLVAGLSWLNLRKSSGDRAA